MILHISSAILLSCDWLPILNFSSSSLLLLLSCNSKIQSFLNLNSGIWKSRGRPALRFLVSLIHDIDCEMVSLSVISHHLACWILDISSNHGDGSMFLFSQWGVVLSLTHKDSTKKMTAKTVVGSHNSRINKKQLSTADNDDEWSCGSERTCRIENRNEENVNKVCVSCTF